MKPAKAAVSPASPTVQAAVKIARSPIRLKATGPRTTAGKKRSRANALKSGVFSKMFLPNESPTDYRSLEEGMKDYFQPQGVAEETLVQELAMITWRKRRIIVAENAEMLKSHKFYTVDSILDQRIEAWDLLRAGETRGGVLRHRKNVFVTRQAIASLELFREAFAQVGFQKGKDPWFLRRMYGLDSDDGAPWGLFRWFVTFCDVATAETPPDDPEDLKQTMLKNIGPELRQLKELQKIQECEEERLRVGEAAAIIPDQAVMDRFIRYEAYLRREFNRTLANLERLQRIRLGQPVLQPIRVDVGPQHDYTTCIVITVGNKQKCKTNLSKYRKISHIQVSS